MVANIEVIPADLRLLPQWVMWKWEEVVDVDKESGEIRLTKVPHQVNGRKDEKLHQE